MQQQNLHRESLTLSYLKQPVNGGGGALVLNLRGEERSNCTVDDAYGEVAKMVRENAVVVIGRRGCFLCHSGSRLLQSLGVNPTIVDVDEKDEAAIVDELLKIVGADDPELNFPAIFVGGRLIGGIDKLMASHLSGELVPRLKEAKALWL